MIERPLRVDPEHGAIVDAYGKRVCGVLYEPGQVTEQISDMQQICDAFNARESEAKK